MSHLFLKLLFVFCSVVQSAIGYGQVKFATKNETYIFPPGVKDHQGRGIVAFVTRESDGEIVVAKFLPEEEEYLAETKTIFSENPEKYRNKHFVVPIDASESPAFNIDKFFETNGQSVVIFPFVGKSLDSEDIKRQISVDSSNFDPKITLEKSNMLFQVFDGMLNLIFIQSEKGFVHLDIKPSNLTWKDSTLYAIDSAGSKKIPFDVTEKQILRTKQFASPEALKFDLKNNKMPITLLSDIYSYGASLKEIVCGGNCTLARFEATLDRTVSMLGIGYTLKSRNFPKEGLAIAKLEMIRSFVRAATLESPEDRLKYLKDGALGGLFEISGNEVTTFRIKRSENFKGKLKELSLSASTFYFRAQESCRVVRNEVTSSRIFKQSTSSVTQSGPNNK